MTRSTFDPEVVLTDGDYALPHAADLSGNLRPLPLIAERGLLPYRPAGALWSNAREMARYLQTELARGVAPGGTRVVSAANLEATCSRGIGAEPLRRTTGDGRDHGALWARLDEWPVPRLEGRQPCRRHGGFTAEIAFLPEADLGIVILSNALSLAPVPLGFEYAIELRLFELLFDQPADFDAELTAQAKALAASRSPPSLGKVDLTAIAPYLGQYDSAELGEVSLSLRGDRLVLDAGDSTRSCGRSPRAARRLSICCTIRRYRCFRKLTARR